MTRSHPTARLCRTATSPRIAFDLLGQGPPIVLLHGIGGSRQDWSDQLEAFSRDHTVAAWDCRGYGDSDDYEGSFSFDDAAKDLACLLDMLGAQRAHIVGLSMGGMIAQCFWHRHSHRVATLVLADSTIGPAASMSEEALAAFVEARRAPLLAGVTMEEIARRNSARLLAPAAPAERLARVQASFASVPASTYLRAIETAVRFPGIPDLRLVAAPTLVICGELDESLPVPMSEALAAAIPGAVLRIIPAAGHLSNVDAPESFNACVLEFLNQHSARADRLTRRSN